MKNILVSIIAITLCFSLVLIGKDWFGNKSSNTWELIAETNIIDTMQFQQIRFFDKNNGIALNPLSIQRTKDAGRNWETVFYEDKKGVYSIYFINDSEGWAVGTDNLEKPLVLKTSDKGISWTRVNYDERSAETVKNGSFTFFRDICFESRYKAWIIGDGGIIQISTSEQELKILNQYSTKESLNRISCSNSGEVWAIAKNIVFYFREGWKQNDLNKKYWFSNVKVYGTDIWLTGVDDFGKGVLLKTQDGGQTWDNKAPESANLLNDLYIKDEIGWLVGAEGKIYYSNDNGSSWNFAKSPTKKDLLKIFFLDSNTGWISGDNATILKYKH